MSKGENKVSKKTAFIVIAVTVALSVLLLLVLWGMGSGGDGRPADHTEVIGTPYEHLLATAMIYAAPLEYPGASEPEIYIAGETAVAKKAESRGVYLRIVVDGTEVILHAAPLAAERQEKGTRDLYTTDLGFATYDAVETDLSELKHLPVDDLQDLASQIGQVMVYSH